MKTKFYLVVTEKGAIRTVKNKPDLSWNEVSLLVSLEVPQRLFQRPQISAEIVINETHVPETEISAEVLNNVKEAIESASGLEVRLSLETDK